MTGNERRIMDDNVYKLFKFLAEYDGIFDSRRDRYPKAPTVLGIPIIEHSEVPKNQVWMLPHDFKMDTDGTVLRPVAPGVYKPVELEDIPKIVMENERGKGKWKNNNGS